MDDTLSNFIQKTGTDPSLARDLLESTKWNLDEALAAFETLSLGCPSKGHDETNFTKKKTAVKANRGLSVVNSDIVVEARHRGIRDEVPGTDQSYESFEEMLDYTFVLPDLSNYSVDLGEFLWRDLIETSTLVALEEAGHLNWWAEVGVCQRLLPLATVGDGNCLLHAASLGMWGYHDRLLTLRKALYRTLTSHLAKGAIKRRWRLQQWQRNMEEGGLVYSEQEWEKEWEEVLRIASTQRRIDGRLTVLDISKREENVSMLPAISEKDTEISSNGEGDVATKNAVKVMEKPASEEGGAFESLEDIHVFALVQVLRRPIIIIADKFLCDFEGQPIAPIPFGGIYLPLECDQDTCLKNPLVLAFDSAHFSPLVPSDEKREVTNVLPVAVPLVGPNLDLLPLQFCVDPGEEFVWSSLDKDLGVADKLTLTVDKRMEILRKYLNVEMVKIPTAKKEETQDKSRPISSKELPVSSVGNSSLNRDDKNAGSKSLVKKERSRIANQLIEVGSAAAVHGSAVHNTVFVAKLQTDRRPEYYDTMIEKYIQSARERFEEEKKAKTIADESLSSTAERPQLCLNPGCQLYGTSVTNYLCSGCFKTQKSYSEKGYYQMEDTNPVTNYDNKAALSCFPALAYSPYMPYGYFGSHSATQSYSSQSTLQQASGLSQASHVQLNSNEQLIDKPPSYAEVTQGRYHVSSAIANSITDSSSEINVELKRGGTSTAVVCAADECQFFGSPQNEGYCSACYKKYQETLKYKAAS